MSEACILLVLITYFITMHGSKNVKLLIVIFGSLTCNLVGGFNFEKNTASTFIHLKDSGLSCQPNYTI
jgi:hypothetical protein